MKFLKKIISNSNFWPLIIILTSAILAGRTFLTPGYFNMHDDLQMMRQLEMEKCFRDLQIPCRWVPDMGYGFGFPLFNYYPPLPYLVGELFRLMHFSFVDTAKILFLLAFIASGVTMYYLAKEFFGKWGGVVSSVFYVWAPYHSVDAYVRGAMNESWALIWFPAIFLFSYKLLAAGSKPDKAKAGNVIYLALSWTGLLLSHNLMVLIFTPVFAGWCLLFWLKDKNWKKVWQLFKAGLLALGLSAFFTLPAVFEQKYVHVDTLVKGYYEYIAHFATINQLLFSRFWGYGASVWGVNDGMSFQVGHIHWILSLVILSFIIFFVIKKKFNYSLLPIIYSLFSGWFAAFMAHEKSTFIWKLIAPLAFVQFPWRFLTIVILCFSFISGSIVLFLKRNSILRVIIPSLLIILLVIINWNYFLPLGGKMGQLTDKEKFSGAAWDLQRTAGIFDYLPKRARENPKEGQKLLAEFMNGAGSIENSKEGTNWAGFTVNSTTSASTVRIGIFQYPVWKTFVDGKEVVNYIPDSEVWGRMYIDLARGTHNVTLKLYNTPLRSAANIVSLVTWLGLIGFAMRRLRVIQFRRG